MPTPGRLTVPYAVFPMLLLICISLTSFAQRSPLRFPVSVFTGHAEFPADDKKARYNLGICSLQVRKTRDNMIAGRRQRKYYQITEKPEPVKADSETAAFTLAYSRKGDEIAYDQQFGTDNGLSYFKYSVRNEPRIRQSVSRSPIADSATGATHLHTIIERTTFHGHGPRAKYQRTLLKNHPSDTCTHPKYPRRLTRFAKQHGKQIVYTRLSHRDVRFDGYAIATVSWYSKDLRIRRTYTTHSRNINRLGRMKGNLRRGVRKAPPMFGAIVLRQSGWNADQARQRGFARYAANADSMRRAFDSSDRLWSAFYRRKDRKGDDLFLGYTEQRYDEENRITSSVEIGRESQLRRVLSYRYDAAERLTGLDVWNLDRPGSLSSWDDSDTTQVPRLNSWNFYYNGEGQVVATERRAYFPADDALKSGAVITLPLPLRVVERFDFAYNENGTMDLFTTGTRVYGRQVGQEPHHEAYELIYGYCPGK